MSGTESSAGGMTVIVQHRGGSGVVAGLLGCALGLLGIFAWGLIFVPLAALCSITVLVRGITGRSAVGVGTSILAGVLSVWGFIVSPSLWVLLGAGILAQHVQPVHAPASSPAVTSRGDTALQQSKQQELELIASMNQLVQRMERFDGYADSLVAKLAAAEQRYHAITSQMRGYLDRERKMAGNRNASVARGQIAVTISQGPIATDQLHIDLQQVLWDFQNNATQLKNRVTATEQSCHRAHRPTPENPVSPGQEQSNAACLRVLDAGAAYRQKFDALARSLAHVEQVYQQELRTQRQIENAANQLE